MASAESNSRAVGRPRRRSNARITRTFLVPNTQTRGFRAGIDVIGDAGQTVDLRVFLRTGSKALTETWTFPWKVE